MSQWKKIADAVQTESGNQAELGQLTGWKEIASYLGRSVRSVQRWEREIGLPIRRIRTSEGQTTYAFKHEIDEWRHTRDLPPTPDPPVAEEAEEIGPRSGGAAWQPPVRRSGRSLTAIASAAALVLLLVGYAVGHTTSGGERPVSALVAAGGTIRGLDPDGQAVWSHEMSSEVMLSVRDHRGKFTRTVSTRDRTLWLFPVRYSPDDRRQTRSDTLLAFNSDGTIRWSYTPDFSLGCGGTRYSGPWQIRAVAVTPESKPRILLAVDHGLYWPGTLVTLDEYGSETIEYVQPGWIMDVAWWPRRTGALVAIAGVSNASGHPTITLLDPAHLAGSAPTADPRFACEETSGADPVSVFTLPNPHLVRDANYGMADGLVPASQTLAAEIQANGAGVILFTVQEDLTQVSLAATDAFFSVHARLESEGEIDHSAANCPFLGGVQRVERWTRAAGWVTTATPLASQPNAPQFKR